MKKEKHPVYRFILGALMVALALGIALLVISLLLGPDLFFLSRELSA